MTVKKTAGTDATVMGSSTQFTECAKLVQAITANLKGLGYGG